MAVEQLYSNRRLKIFTTYIRSFRRCKERKLLGQSCHCQMWVVVTEKIRWHFGMGQGRSFNAILTHPAGTCVWLSLLFQMHEFILVESITQSFVLTSHVGFGTQQLLYHVFIFHRPSFKA